MISRQIPALLTVAWGVFFGGLNLLWSFGNRWLVPHLAESIQRDVEAGTDSIMLFNTFGGLGKLALAGLALLSITAAGDRIPRWMYHLGLGLAGVLLFLYGAINWGTMAAVKLGWRDVPTSIGAEQIDWYFWLWEPLWMIGGLLLLASWWVWRRREDRYQFSGR